MSLTLAARFDGGIIVAADAFVFDNHRERPSAWVDFRKLAVLNERGCVLAAVGSQWVFQQATAELGAGDPDQAPDWEAFGLSWASLNATWKADREREDTANGASTLRPVSASVVFVASQHDLSRILIVDPEGRLESTTSYVFAGSGSDLARSLLGSSPAKFSPAMPLKNTLALLRRCYDAASQDLYVSGWPTIAIVRSTGIVDLTDVCAQRWQAARDDYFSAIMEDADNR